MQRAIEETDRRRAKQVEHNTEHGITPVSVVRDVVDIMEGARVDPDALKGRNRARQVAEEMAEYAALSPSQLSARIKKLEQKMYQHARDLEFEQAAAARDQLHRLKEQGFGA
jgi:excinuclease ABC subunit B